MSCGLVSKFHNASSSFEYTLDMSKKKTVKRAPRPVAKWFEARLERIESRFGWVIIRVPLNVQRIWGTRGRLKVKGEINGFAFRTSLFPSRKGDHIMLVNKRMQAGGRVGPGMFAQFRLQPDTEERTVAPPAADYAAGSSS